MREKQVGVAVVCDDLDRFLLVRNPRWQNQFALPMKDVDEEADVLPSTAIKALESDLGRRLPRATAEQLAYLGRFGRSGASGAETLYEYWAYEVTLGEALGEPTGDAAALRWATYDELSAAPDVTWATKEIAKAFVENQEVALAVVCRLAAVATEYLLVWNGNYGGFFLPSMRIKDELKAGATARMVLRSDFGYRGEVIAQESGIVDHPHYSRRYGRDRHYHFHVCHVLLPHLDLNQPLNFLERRMQARGMRWRWYSAEQLGTPPDRVSPTLAAVRATVLQCVPPTTRTQPLRKSEGGVALIRRRLGDRTEWLAQWNDHWKAFFFVGGHRDPTEDFRSCVLRETAEELELNPAKDFIVAPTPKAQMRYVAYSHSAMVDTTYEMELYDVTLHDHALRNLDASSKNRWLTEREIRRMEAFDGRQISVTVPVLLTKAGLMEWRQ